MKGIVSMPIDQPQEESTYVMDAESATEMARLLNQDRLMTQGMGGLFVERADDLSDIHDVLDIGCGPGGWVQDVAFTYPHINVTGIDISKQMIDYASAYARVQHLKNASFRVMDALKPLDFPDNSFDLVNARFIVGFTPKTSWPALLQECKRILRPGGIFRLTESEGGFSTSQACNDLSIWLFMLLKRIGFTFSPDGRSIGIMLAMRRLLREAGFENIQKMAHVTETAPGLEGYSMGVNNIKVTFQTLMPTLVKMGITTPEEFERVYDTALRDVLADDFCALGFFVTMWGQKPA
jgi:ubiquinone/menaquinone biosynthesis C-methylase UbiE